MLTFELLFLDVLQGGNADIKVRACIALHKSNLEQAAKFLKAATNQLNDARLLDDFKSLPLKEGCDNIENLFHVFVVNVRANILEKDAQSLSDKKNDLVLRAIADWISSTNNQRVIALLYELTVTYHIVELCYLS